MPDETIDWITADWPAPAPVRAFTTLRQGGVSTGAFAGLNLGDHVGDDRAAVAHNRAALRLAAALPSEPRWLRQVHGRRAIDARSWVEGVEADAVHCREPNVVCAVLTADCLPVLLCDRAGTAVAAVHAGWRGLLDGVIESAIAAMARPPAALLAWIGPAIGPRAWEVGPEVKERFTAVLPEARRFFRVGEAGRLTGDLPGLARLRLRRAGIDAIHGGGWCTHSEPRRFYSYRRDGTTGRMASLIWVEQSRT